MSSSLADHLPAECGPGSSGTCPSCCRSGCHDASHLHARAHGVHPGRVLGFRSRRDGDGGHHSRGGDGGAVGHGLDRDVVHVRNLDDGAADGSHRSLRDSLPFDFRKMAATAIGILTSRTGVAGSCFAAHGIPNRRPRSRRKTRSGFHRPARQRPACRRG